MHDGLLSNLSNYYTLPILEPVYHVLDAAPGLSHRLPLEVHAERRAAAAVDAAVDVERVHRLRAATFRASMRSWTSIATFDEYDARTASQPDMSRICAIRTIPSSFFCRCEEAAVLPLDPFFASSSREPYSSPSRELPCRMSLNFFPAEPSITK